MKTNIKSLMTGTLATIAIVAISTAVQAQPVTGWGRCDVYANTCTVNDSGGGNFQVLGQNVGNLAYQAPLPQKFALQNVGDRITVTGWLNFTNGQMNGTVWRIFLGSTNPPVGTPGVLTSGVYVGGQYTGWLGYELNSGGIATCYAKAGVGTSRPWPSDAFDVNPLNLSPIYSAIPGTIPPDGQMDSAGAPYYFTFQVQLVAPEVSAVGWCITNAAFVTNAPSIAFGDTFTVTNFGVVIDDGTLVGNLTGPRPQELATKNFDMLGFFESSADRNVDTEVDYHDVTVSFTTGNPDPFTNIVIDAFNPAGYNGYSYSGGQLIDVWTNWFGAAWVTNEWNSTNDANPLTDGSIRVTATWPNTTPAAQFMEYNQKLVHPFTGNGSPDMDGGLNLREFGADVFYDSDSTVVTNGTTPIYGHLRFGMQDFAGNFEQFSNGIGTTGQGFDYPQASNGWRHLNYPLNGFNQPGITTISNIAFGIDGNWYTTAPLTNGTTKLFVDNIHFLEQTNLLGVHVVNPPPTIGIEKPTYGLRIFNRAATKYTRNELASANQTESWVGAGSYPVSYSFTITNMPVFNSAMEVVLWLIPTASMTTNPYADNGVDVDATNVMGLIISTGNAITGTNQVYGADLMYKTNAPGASLNPGSASPIVTLATNFQTAVTGPASGNGTWTLTFTDNNHGSITGPGCIPKAFTIPTGDEQYFNGNLVAYFGIQPNGSLDVHVDYTRITIVNGANSVDANFAAGADLSQWTVVGDTLGCWLVPSTTAWWINWSAPAIGYDVEENNNNNIGAAHANWVAPALYAGYSPNLVERLQGPRYWTQIPTADLPPGQTNGYFRLSKPVNAP